MLARQGRRAITVGCGRRSHATGWCLAGAAGRCVPGAGRNSPGAPGALAGEARPGWSPFPARPSPASLVAVPPPARRVLVSDFDGTMTRFDFFELARRDLPSAAGRDHWQDYLDGRITHFEALARIFGAIRASREAVEAVVERMELDPALPGAVGRLRAAGWEVVVASAGCDWYIRRLLVRAGLSLEVHANPGTFSPGSGLALSPPTASPYFTPSTGIDKVAVVRAALARDPRAVFAGDGRPDLEPSALVAPARRFARGWLAGHLASTGQPFRPLDSWSRVADWLLEEP